MSRTQYTILLKGALQMAGFFGIAAVLLGYAGVHGWRYARVLVQKAKAANERKKGLEFQYTTTLAMAPMPGYLLLAPAPQSDSRYSRLLIMDMKGKVRWSRQEVGRIFDFRQWKIGGVNYYSYALKNLDSTADGPVQNQGSHQVVLDAQLRPIKTLHLQDYAGVSGNSPGDLDPHDFLMLDTGHFFTMASYPRVVTNIPSFLSPAPQAKVLAPVLQELKGGKVVWQWDGSNFPELYQNSFESNNYYDTSKYQDYAHINGLTMDGRDSNLLVSFRNLNQIIKIDRKTGGILWRLGGRNSDFTLLPGQVFLRQHHPTLLDSGRKLLLFDNGEKTIRPYSRVVEYRLDEATKSIVGFYSLPISEAFSGARGSVQQVGSNYLICGGIAKYVLLADAATGAKKLELTTNQSTYRAMYVPDVDGLVLDGK